jgi:DNA repair protein RecO (recombination protein O)
LEPFTRITVQLARARDLSIVTQVETLEAYLSLREDLLLMGYASYAMELLDRFTYDEEGGNPVIFRLLTETLARLSLKVSNPGWPCVFTKCACSTVWDTVRSCLCAATAGAIFCPKTSIFRPSSGGVICPRCGAGLPGLWQISMGRSNTCVTFSAAVSKTPPAPIPPAEEQKELETLMQAYFTYLLERSLNTPGF